MEKRMKLSVSRIVSSCKPRDLYDVVETSLVTSHTTTSSERFVRKESKTRSQRLLTKASSSTSFSCPMFPPNPFYEERSQSFRVKTNKKQRPKFGSDSLLINASSRFKSSGSWCWSSSDEEEDEDDDVETETETFFSSRSFSSESSGSFAVVKKSKDPYEDFRKSMVEMIVERQIFSANELQKLLQCFLSLNSRQHHSVIVKVFLEIYSTLFSP